MTVTHLEGPEGEWFPHVRLPDGADWHDVPGEGVLLQLKGKKENLTMKFQWFSRSLWSFNPLVPGVTNAIVSFPVRRKYPSSQIYKEIS